MSLLNAFDAAKIILEVTFCKTWEIEAVFHFKVVRNLFWELLLVTVGERIW